MSFPKVIVHTKITTRIRRIARRLSRVHKTPIVVFFDKGIWFKTLRPVLDTEKLSEPLDHSHWDSVNFKEKHSKGSLVDLKRNHSLKHNNGQRIKITQLETNHTLEQRMGLRKEICQQMQGGIPAGYIHVISAFHKHPNVKSI